MIELDEKLILSMGHYAKYGTMTPKRSLNVVSAI